MFGEYRTFFILFGIVVFFLMVFVDALKKRAVETFEGKKINHIANIP